MKVYQNGVFVGTATETATPGTFTFTSAALTDGSYSFTATATDAADNTSAASAPFAIIDRPHAAVGAGRSPRLPTIPAPRSTT